MSVAYVSMCVESFSLRQPSPSHAFLRHTPLSLAARLMFWAGLRKGGGAGAGPTHGRAAGRCRSRNTGECLPRASCCSAHVTWCCVHPCGARRLHVLCFKARRAALVASLLSLSHGRRLNDALRPPNEAKTRLLH